jgi:hypothetical protein
MILQEVGHIVTHFPIRLPLTGKNCLDQLHEKALSKYLLIQATL